MYLYPGPPEFGIIMAIVAVVALLVFILKRAHVPQVLHIVFAIIALPIYLLLSIIEKCRKENSKK